MEQPAVHSLIPHLRRIEKALHISEADQGTAMLRSQISELLQRSFQPQDLRGIQSPLMHSTIENVRALSGPLFRDLQFLEMVGEGNLNAVNEFMDDQLWAIMMTRKKPQQEEAQRELNALLMKAIRLFPTLAKSVEIVLSPLICEQLEIFHNQFGYEYDRQKINRLIEAYESYRGEVFPGLLRVPLPYNFSTETHGSGERACAMNSSRNVFFTNIQRRSGGSVPALAVKVAPMISHLSLGEVDTIRLSSASQFTPCIKDFENPPNLCECPSAIHHYLDFRGFRQRGPNCIIDRKPPDLQETEWCRCIDELNVSSSTTLWNVDYADDGSKILQHGFIAGITTAPEECALIEFSNVPLSTTDPAHLYVQVMMRGNPGNWPIVKGEQIISRLSTVPLGKRCFGLMEVDEG